MSFSAGLSYALFIPAKFFELLPLPDRSVILPSQILLMEKVNSK